MTMQHWRRTKLLRALRELYLDNFKRSESWSYEYCERNLKAYNLVRQKLEISEAPRILEDIKRKEVEAEKHQLRLF